jgi:hypothetical protein
LRETGTDREREKKIKESEKQMTGKIKYTIDVVCKGHTTTAKKLALVTTLAQV